MAARQQIVIELVDKVSRSLGNIENRLKSLDGNTKKLDNSFGSVAKAAKGFIAALAVREIVQFGSALIDSAQKFETYNNQLRLLTTSQAELDETFDKLRVSSISTRSAFGDTVDLYAKLTLATENMNKSQEEVLLVTERFQKALAISGADANTASGAIRQLGQAMASGQVRGDEFNSIVEALGPALNIMARQSGITVGELRKMSQAGNLNAEVFFKMIQNATSLDEAFNRTQITTAQLEQQLSDAFDEAANSVVHSTGLQTAYNNVLQTTIDLFRDIAGTTPDPDDLAKAGNFEEAIRQIERLRKGELTAYGYILFQTEEITRQIDAINQKYDEQIAKIQRLQQDQIADNKLIAIANEVNAERLRIISGLTDEFGNYTERTAEYNTALERAIPKQQQMTDLQSFLQQELVKVERAMQENSTAANELADYHAALQGRLNLVNQELRDFEADEAAKELKEFERSVKDATSGLSKYENIVASAMTEQQRMATEIEEAERYLAELNTAAREGGDAMAQALAPAIDTVSTALGFMKSELANVGNELSGFDKYYKDLIDNANRTANETVYAVQAQQKLKEQLDAGIISIDVYAAGMERFATATVETTGATRDYIDELETLERKYTEVLGNQIELLERNAAKEIQQLKEIAAARPELAAKAAQIELAIEKQLANDKIAEARRVAEAQKKIYNDNFRIFESGKYAELDLSKMTEDQKTKFALDAGRSALAGLAQHNRRAFQLNKALMIAEAVINVATGVTKALAQGGIFGPLLAGAIVAAGAVQIATIRNMQYQGRAAGGEMTVGRPTVVGEAGPEIVVPKQPSVVMPNSVKERLDAMGSSNGGGPVTVNFNITTLDAKDFDTLLIERRSVISGIVNDAMQRRGRQGVLS